MHRPPFAGTQRRTRCSRRLRPCRALKNWLARHRTPRCRPRRRSRRRLSRRRQRRFIHRSRSSLRHDHSRQRRNRSRRLWRRRTWGLHLRDIVRRRLRNWRSTCALRRRTGSGNSRRNGNSRRSWSRRGCRRGRGRWRHGNFGRNHYHRRWTVSGSHRSRRHHSWRGGRRCGRFDRRLDRNFLRRSFGSGFNRWRNGRLDGRTYCGMLNHSLLLSDGAQHISGPRDVRKVDLGLDFFFAVSGARRWPRRTRR